MATIFVRSNLTLVGSDIAGSLGKAFRSNFTIHFALVCDKSASYNDD